MTSTDSVSPNMLVPIVHPNEALRPHIPVRPALSLAETPLQLGRNSLTQIADLRLSRHCCRITQMENGRYKVLATKPTSVFYLNGTKHDMNTTSNQNVILNDGDTLCLYNEHDDSDEMSFVVEESFQYAYTVRLRGEADAHQENHHNHNNTLSSPGRSPARKRRASEVAASGDDDDDDDNSITTPYQPQLQAAAEEFSCAFCLDILVQATTLVPCGHVFCQCCVASHEQCPTCRAHVKSTVACRTMDNAIAAMAFENNPFFAADDLEVYRQRMQDTGGNGGGNSSSSQSHANRSTKRAKRRHLQAAASAASHGGKTAEDAICID